MSIIDTLITNRTQADVDALLALYAKPEAMWTVDEWNEFLLGNHRGAYNASDMNRVLDALDYLAGRLRGYGYNVPEIKRPSITEVIPGTSRLPEGYTELEYIEGSGTEYIDSLFRPSGNTKVVMDVWLNSTIAANGVATCFGCHEGSTYYRLITGSGANWALGYEYGTVYTSYWPMGSLGALNTRRTIVTDKGVATIDGITKTYSNQAFQMEYSLYLLANNGSGIVQYITPGKIYSCQIYEQDVIVRDFIPCLNPTGEVGLYDIVNGVFHGNAGTGEFVAGYLPAIDSKTLLLLHGDALEDSSTYGQELENFGVVVSSDQSKFGDKSLYFDGNSKILIPPVDFGENDFTIDWWEYVTNSSSKVRFHSAFFSGTPIVLGLLLGYNSTMVYASSNGSTWDLVSGKTMLSNTLNTWVHWAFVRKGNTLTSYRNGTTFATATINGAIYNDGITPSAIGSYYAEDESPFIGYIDEFRISNVARWTEGFSPPEHEYTEPETPTETIIRNYYKTGDRPTASALSDYLDNVAHVRNALDVPGSVPAVPEDLSKRITIEEANNIENILTAVELLLNRIPLSWVYSGEVYSGEV